MLQGSILDKLSQAHRGLSSGKRPLNFGVYYKHTLVSLCHALEDVILASRGACPVVVTAFQRGKWYLEEADRYQEIAGSARQVVIMAAPDAGFAEHPTSQLGNVALVPLDPQDPVAQEWHLVIFAPSYTAMVLCQELSVQDYGPEGPPQEDRERKFYGLWTFEPDLVRETLELLIQKVGSYQPQLQTRLQAQLQEMAEQKVQPEDLKLVVSRIVDYLEASQADRPHHLTSNLTANELQAYLRTAQVLDQLDLRNPQAAAQVAALAEALGQLLDLPGWQLNRLRLAGLLHRLGMLAPGGNPWEVQGPVCPLVPGVQALRVMGRLRALAVILNHLQEWWNGQGQPAGLVGETIPLESRILSLVIDFQQHLTPALGFGIPRDDSLELAVERIRAEAGTRWDPSLVGLLELLVASLRQGLDLPVSPPRIAAGLWWQDAYGTEITVISAED